MLNRQGIRQHQPTTMTMMEALQLTHLERQGTLSIMVITTHQRQQLQYNLRQQARQYINPWKSYLYMGTVGTAQKLLKLK
ncbi:MAG: hypothetical protein HW406_1158 [Candidatus Brocadiaceae bacterium]|nr:hypothetical protein [Candidatus Brocadiaceae bacterium]